MSHRVELAKENQEDATKSLSNGVIKTVAFKASCRGIRGEGVEIGLEV